MNYKCNECNDSGSRDKLGTYLDCNACGTAATRRDLNDFVKSLGPTHPEDVALAIHQRALAMAPKQDAPAAITPVAWGLLSTQDQELTNDPVLADYWKRKGRDVTPLYADPVAANGASNSDSKNSSNCTGAAGPDAVLIKDAMRYRYLRNNASEDMPTWPVSGSCWVVQYHHPQGTIPELKSAGFASELDRAIDAAIALSGAKGN